MKIIETEFDKIYEELSNLNEEVFSDETIKNYYQNCNRAFSEKVIKNFMLFKQKIIKDWNTEFFTNKATWDMATSMYIKLATEWNKWYNTGKITELELAKTNIKSLYDQLSSTTNKLQNSSEINKQSKQTLLELCNILSNLYKKLNTTNYIFYTKPQNYCKITTAQALFENELKTFLKPFIDNLTIFNDICKKNS